MVGEVTTLEHELGDDSVEARTGVSEAVLSSAELSEVSSGLGDDVVVAVWFLEKIGNEWEKGTERQGRNSEKNKLSVCCSWIFFGKEETRKLTAKVERATGRSRAKGMTRTERGARQSASGQAKRQVKLRTHLEGDSASRGAVD